MAYTVLKDKQVNEPEMVSLMVLGRVIVLSECYVAAKSLFLCSGKEKLGEASFEKGLSSQPLVPGRSKVAILCSRTYKTMACFAGSKLLFQHSVPTNQMPLGRLQAGYKRNSPFVFYCVLYLLYAGKVPQNLEIIFSFLNGVTEISWKRL